MKERPYRVKLLMWKNMGNTRINGGNGNNITSIGGISHSPMAFSRMVYR